MNFHSYQPQNLAIAKLCRVNECSGSKIGVQPQHPRHGGVGPDECSGSKIGVQPQLRDVAMRLVAQCSGSKIGVQPQPKGNGNGKP